MKIASFIALAATLLLASPTQARKRGITGRAAPAIAGQWLNVHAGEVAPDVRAAAAQGKVVYLFFFQSWCPGCHSRGFPTLKAVRERFADDDRVVFAAVQTVFEGFGTNDADSAMKAMMEHGLDDLPVAQDAGPAGSGSVTMRRYRSGGTPWTVIIGPDGVVRFDGFRINTGQAVGLIERLLPKT